MDELGFVEPKKIIEELELKEGMKIADFGSGGGFYVFLFARKVGPEGKVYALDIQKEGLEALAGKARIEGLLNIDTIWADLERPNGSKIEPVSVDLVLIANILFQVQKKSDVIKEAKRILKSGGKLVMVEWRDDVEGMGPPKNLRLSKEEAKKLAESEELRFYKEFLAGSHHYALVYEK